MAADSAAMRVRTTILLLLVLAGVAFVAGLVAVRRVEAEKLAAATAALEGEWRELTDKLWREQSAPVRMVSKLPRDVGVLDAILSGDQNLPSKDFEGRTLAQEWDERMLTTYDADALWVYRRDGTLFYSRARTNDLPLRTLPMPAEAVVRMFGRGEAPQFSFELSREEGGHLRIVEVCGAPVRPTWDKDKKEAPEAFFLAGRVWDDERLKASPPPGSLPPGVEPPKLRPIETEPAQALSPGVMRYLLPLRDWQGRDIAQIVFTRNDQKLVTLVSRGDRVFLALLVGALALFVILYLLLERAVVHPLRRVIRSLHEENIPLLEPLRRQKAEFGELARLIHDFFAQRAALTREMHERSAAEKALRESEEKLRHSQKMEAVGRLAGGVAHDFNNLLTAIIGYADLLRQRFAGDPSARQPVELIHQAGEQAAGLTRQLLAFSRRQLLQPRVIDLNVVVANLHRLLQRIIGEHIEICVESAPTPACVKADPGQIEQVIVNLGVNARDAMPRGGRLTIRTCHVELDGSDASTELPPGEYVAIEVTDTGEGMDEATKARIFEPFFTTKGPGKGTGLGLATVYGIVRQSRGGIVVESERGRGSTFRILLPREHSAPDAREEAPATARTAARAERILVVEDEEIVRDLVSEILRGQGYEVLATDRGSEAARMAHEDQCGIDLLISDVVMPEMNGAEVARRIHEISPRTRVLFVSGYSENDMADQGLEALAFQVLQKPFNPAALAKKVREVLEAPV